jgi:hypothetical protein
MQKLINIEKEFNTNKASYYNLHIKIDSMNQLFNEGWKVIRLKSEKNEKKENVEKQVAIVSVLGNKNSGKSFFLSLLTNKKIPNGYSVTTEGLSFIIPDNDKNKDDNYILIDTAGTESPLLSDNIKELTIEMKDRMAKDRQITDYFLQKFILENSDIFICVVDNLTLTDQKFINRIIKNYTSKKIYIIHNLKTFIEKDQVEQYIENTLMQSLTFELQKENYKNLDGKTKDELAKQNQIYFKQKLKDSNRVIVHLLLANEESKAGEFYNKSTINYLNHQLDQIKVKKEFKIIDSLKDFLVAFSGEIFDKKIEEASIKIENDSIKLINQDLKLKDCLMDELGNNIITDTTFKPKYRCGYFTENEEKKFALEIELFEEWNLSHRIKIDDNYFYIYIDGQKEQKIGERNYEFKNCIPNDKFELVIKIDNCKGIVQDNPKTEEDNGLYILIFSLREKYIEEDVVSEEESVEEEKEND